MRSLLGAAGVILLSGAALPLLSADHREAPTINEFPPGDINDIYAFTEGGDLVFVMTVNPLAVPAFAGSYAFSPNVLYRFEVDTTGDAVPEHAIDVTFTPPGPDGQTFTAEFPTGIVVEGPVTRPTVLTEVPNDPVVVEGPEGILAFCGPRDDPFFFDAVGFNRFLAADPDPFEEEGRDTFAGFNVSAIVLRFPPRLVADGRNQLQISGFTYPLLDAPGFDDPDLVVENLRPLDRMGNPAVATVLIPSPMRDTFNQRLPADDVENFGSVIVASLEGFGTPPANIEVLGDVALPDTLKLDLSRPVEYPNGRELDDDVIDTLLQLILGDPAASDNVDSNDKEFLDTFPYLAPPHQTP